MHWHEKINLLKKQYSSKEFSVPHVDRKRILRKIEAKFISRSEDYYELNNFNERFCNWWQDLQYSQETAILIQPNTWNVLSSLVDPEESYWIVAEFSNGVMVYKAKKNALLDLMVAGRTWTNTFHLFQLKYEYGISTKFEAGQIKIKICGDSTVGNLQSAI